MGKKKEQKFEEMLKRLQEISDMLDSDEIGIEETLELYEEGIKLSQKCYSKLKDAEVKIVKLNRELEENFAEETDDE